MIIDARTLPNNESLDADICIVGAGTAGLILAYSLIGTGFDILLLESGGLKPDKGSHALNWGENIGLPYYNLDVARARFFAGCCNRWHVALGNKQLGARIRPLDPIDFEYRHWVPHSGWPFDKSHIETYYERAQGICRTTPVSYEVDTWRRSNGFEVLPLDPGFVKTIIFKFCSKNPFIHDYADAVKRANTIKTLLFANVFSIDLSDNAKKVSALKVASFEGNQFHVRARVYILAAGGIEIPRLLLTSTNRMRHGVGNQYDLVGRFFMEHLHFWSGLLIPFDKKLIGKMALYNSIQIINDVPVIAKLAPSEDIMRRERLINHNIQLIPTIVPRSTLYPYLYPMQNSGAVSAFKSVLSDLKHGRLPSVDNFAKSVTGFDSIAKAGMHKGYRKLGRTFDRRQSQIYRLANMTEQIPNPDCRVTLGEERDQFGIPRVKLNWRVTQQDLSNAVRIQQIVAREVEKAGVGRMHIQLSSDTIPGNLHGGYHHMGTTRMHRDSKSGVVDENCRVHGLSNLYIAGPSVFPTGGYANPVLTIVALTLRLADYITQVLRTQ